MQRDPRFEALLREMQHTPSRPVGLMQKIGAVLAGIVVFALALTVSVLFFAVVVAVGLVVSGVVWWKTRALRKAMREVRAEAERRASQGPAPNEGIVIEGEVVREVREERREGARD